jgi:hypothetical protein
MQPALVIEPSVLRLDESGGAIVNVHEDGIEVAGTLFSKAIIDITREDLHSLLIEELTVESLKVLTVPSHDIW